MSGIQTRQIEYEVAGTVFKSQCAFDDSGAEKPGVLVFPEWWGLNDYVTRRASQLAELGYSAMAVDMYGDGLVASTPDEAGGAMNAVWADVSSARDRIVAAMEALQSQPQTDATRVAAIGYCFGGALVLHAARTGMDLKAVASFHGALKPFHRAERGQVNAAVLVCHGAADSLVPDEDVDALKQEMTEADVNFEFIAYPGALHGFTNPDATAKGKEYGLPLAYDQATDQQSWQAMLSLFEKTLA